MSNAENTRTKKKSTYLIMLFAFIGALIACFLDAIQKGHSSSLFRINEVLTSLIGMHINKIITILLISLIATALCFLEEIGTPKKAFAYGLGIFSVIMTIVPAKEEQQIERGGKMQDAGAASRGSFSSFFVQSAYAYEPIHRQTLTHVEIQTNAPDGKTAVDSKIFIKKLNGDERVQYADKGLFDFNLEPGQYEYRIEAKGYAVVKNKFSVEAGNPKRYTITMVKSSTALSIQRLFE